MVRGGVNDGPGARDSPDRFGHVLYERAAGTDFVREWLDATTPERPQPAGPVGSAGPPGPSVQPSGQEAVDLLCVTASVTVDEWFDLVRGRDGVGSAGLVSIGDGVRSTAGRSTSAPTTPVRSTGPTIAGDSMAFATVGDPADLPSVGLAVEAFVDDWRDSGARTLVCLDALPAFFERREEVRVLRFVAALLVQLEYQGVAVHAVVVPDAVDVWTRSSLASLFGTIDHGEHDDA